MSIDVRFVPGGEGRSSVGTIRLDGPQEIFRFAIAAFEAGVVAKGHLDLLADANEWARAIAPLVEVENDGAS